SPRDCLRGLPSGEWLIDPILVDSALQMQVLWARMHWDVTLLPARIQCCRVVRRVGDTSGKAGACVPFETASEGEDGARGVRYELRVRPESQEPTSHADHYFFDNDGRLLGFLTGVEGTGSKALNRLAERCRR